ncbi:NUDIX hydrolase [Paraburkholderia sediminicola]|uniref:NUDIX hydrolase n=1 Tax=Paraburkholderia sediminicola TaxID=458836 RepID=UPI0038B998F1
MFLLFAKAHVKQFTRKDGTVVHEHDTKVVKKVKWHNSLTGSKQTAEKLAAKPSGKDALHPSWALPPDAVTHPKRDDDGKAVIVKYPSQQTGTDTWKDPHETAMFTPGGHAPASLNGVPLAPWTDHPKTIEGWDHVPGQMHDLEEPEMDLRGKEPAAGVFITEPDGRVWMVKPSNGFAGYSTTFPKGHADDGISLQATAIKEAFEESGLQVEITGLIGDVERGQTVTRYYTAKRVGGSPTDMGWETQAVMLVPPGSVHAAANRAYDRKLATMAGLQPVGDVRESVDDWKKVGKQLGSNPGGFFKDPSGQEWYVKVPRSTAIARNEILAGKLYEAAGVKVPELKEVTVGDRTAIASKIVPGLQKLSDFGSGNATVMDGFAVDAWLANWDVVGLQHDNLLEDENGDAVRVDVGGSLVFRAQGDPKGKHFGDTVGELDSLTSGQNPQAAAVFGGITHKELLNGVKKVASVSTAKIKSLVMDYGPGNPEQKAELARKLIARRADLLKLK